MLEVRCKFIYIFPICIVVSLSLLGISIWLHFSDSATLCVKVLEKPSLILGVSLLVYTVIGLVESFCRVKFIIWICIILSSLFNLGLICFTVFSILVTNRNVSRALFGKEGYYSHYLLEKYVMNAEQIKSCFLDLETCQHLPTGKGADFYKYRLSHTQSSCCKPPTYCGLELQNATYWTIPKAGPEAGPAVSNNDCKIWNNVQSELCFKCQSCKTIFYDIIEKHWKILSLINFVLLLFCCCVLYYVLIWINNRSKGHPRHKVYPAV